MTQEERRVWDAVFIQSMWESARTPITIGSPPWEDNEKAQAPARPSDEDRVKSAARLGDLAIKERRNHIK